MAALKLICGKDHSNAAAHKPSCRKLISFTRNRSDVSNCGRRTATEKGLKPPPPLQYLTQLDAPPYHHASHSIAQPLTSPHLTHHHHESQGIASPVESYTDKSNTLRKDASLSAHRPSHIHIEMPKPLSVNRQCYHKQNQNPRKPFIFMYSFRSSKSCS
jgi:hypothetical protein